MSKVLYVCSEAYPLVKTGGLGDVAGSLPPALLKKSQDVRLLLPAYPDALSKTGKHRVRVSTSCYQLPVKIIETRLPGTNVIVWLVDCPAAFNRPGGPYVDERGHEWHDNALRFAIFCHLAVELSLDRHGLQWRPDVVHCNDWQTGLVPALLSLYQNRPATVFTIHNLAYQGVFDQQIFSALRLPQELWHIDVLEYYGQFSFIKGGITCADKITTVSPSYAREILQPEHGYGLDGLLRSRAKDLFGILNGIDVKLWNPGTDTYLEKKYNRRSLNNKKLNKTYLQKVLKLPVDSSVPMLGMVSRLVQQKGLDILLQSLPDLLAQPIQLVVLGTGDAGYEKQLSEWSQKHPDRLKAIHSYDEAMAHRIEAASDIYLMPSYFEPCGLNQLYSMRYGTLPVVTHVGGLADTVVDAVQENIDDNTANGFVLYEHSSSALLATVQRALALYGKPELWRQLQLNAMSRDFSWKASAEYFIKLYQSLA